MPELQNAGNELQVKEMMNITTAAKEKFISLLDEADDNILGVRVYVSGGGCSGMQYGMTFADQRSEYDYEMIDEKMRLIIDPVALNYMEGAQIDFIDDGVNATFVFNDVFQSVGGSGSCGGCGSAA